MVLRGIKYPLQLDGNGSLAISERADVVREQIVSAIETNPGERIMIPLYGLREHILSSLAPAVVVSDIENTLTRWVPEAKNIRVTFDKNADKFENGLLDVTITFQYDNREVTIEAELDNA